ncbi:hypothetical protein [Alienimonas californiensis]|uniref:Secreted protein n=1 Tax=Alienimonas californiensis TaxID=2527989 RepID=A0A517P9F0_9PLAN|nr:hypothetical protein [Alienimonas californiensis]QDT15992.1 hypothetical protein CA12_20900 [Alienimonas californiensis]
MPRSRPPAAASFARGGLAVALLAALSAGAGLAAQAANQAVAEPPPVSGEEEEPVRGEDAGRATAGDRFAIVQDDTLGVRPAEGALYEAVLDELRVADAASLEAEAARFRTQRREALNVPDNRDFPAFPDLFKHPDAYRGQAVTLIGQARKVTEFPAGPTAADPEETRVSVVLYTDDSQTNPAVVVALAAPGLPRGDDLLEPVKVTGRFFKRWGYEARDGKTRIAPLILAERVEPLPVEPPPPATPFVLALTAAVAVVGLSAGLWAWWLRPKRRKGPVAAGGGETPDLGGFTPPPENESEFPRGE